MRLLIRIVAMFIVIPASFYFIVWVPFAFLPPINGFIRLFISLICALAIGWFVWKKLGTMTLELGLYIFLGGVILGSISFILGFFGPIIFAPEANQGPLLGIFITGPLGFLIGLIGGGVFWFIKKSKLNN